MAFCVMSLFVPVSHAIEGLKYEGSSTIGEVVMPKLAKAYRSKTGVTFVHIGKRGSGAGFKSVLAGKADMGGLSRALSEKEKGAGLFQKEIGYDAIAIFVNEKNPVADLTKEQLKGIFTGKITNWKEVGGNDAAIMVATEKLDGERATVKVFKKLALDGQGYGPVKQIDKPHACVRFVTMNVNAITHASINFKERGVKMVTLNGVEPAKDNIASGKYFLQRPLILVTNNPPAKDVSAFIDFVVSKEGQAIVGRYFSPAL
jgi:phosphate transport system substrate-binding protein